MPYAGILLLTSQSRNLFVAIFLRNKKLSIPLSLCRVLKCLLELGLYQYALLENYTPPQFAGFGKSKQQ